MASRHLEPLTPISMGREWGKSPLFAFNADLDGERMEQATT